MSKWMTITKIAYRGVRGGGVRNPENFAYVLYGWPPTVWFMYNSVFPLSLHGRCQTSSKSMCSKLFMSVYHQNLLTMSGKLLFIQFPYHTHKHFLYISSFLLEVLFLLGIWESKIKGIDICYYFSLSVEFDLRIEICLEVQLLQWYFQD